LPGEPLREEAVALQESLNWSSRGRIAVKRNKRKTPKRKFAHIPSREEARQRFEDAGGYYDDRVMSFVEWCGSNNISVSTGRRIKRSGTGPNFIRIGTSMLGVTVAENRRWRESRIIR
jgi:hypothetical protein